MILGEKQLMEHDKEVSILTYASHQEVHVTVSSIIKWGLLTLNKTDGSIVYQKVLSNTNYEHIAIPKDIKTLRVSIISDEINYEKILNL